MSLLLLLLLYWPAASMASTPALPNPAVCAPHPPTHPAQPSHTSTYPTKSHPRPPHQDSGLVVAPLHFQGSQPSQPDIPAPVLPDSQVGEMK